MNGLWDNDSRNLCCLDMDCGLNNLRFTDNIDLIAGYGLWVEQPEIH